MKIVGAHAFKALLMSAAGLSLSACASGGGVPRVENIRPMQGATAESQISQDFAAGRPAIRRVRLSGYFFALKPMGGAIPTSINAAPFRITFRAHHPTFSPLPHLPHILR